MSIIWGDVCAVINKMLLKIWMESLFWYLVEDQTKKAVATHSSTLAWKIPWTEEPGRLQFMGSLSQTWLSDFTFPFHFHSLEKEMATHSSVLAWGIPGTGEPGGLLSMGSHRVRHYWSNLAAAAEEAQKEMRNMLLEMEGKVILVVWR